MVEIRKLEAANMADTIELQYFKDEVKYKFNIFDIFLFQNLNEKKLNRKLKKNESTLKEEINKMKLNIDELSKRNEVRKF